MNNTELSQLISIPANRSMILKRQLFPRDSAGSKLLDCFGSSRLQLQEARIEPAKDQQPAVLRGVLHNHCLGLHCFDGTTRLELILPMANGQPAPSPQITLQPVDSPQRFSTAFIDAICELADHPADEVAVEGNSFDRDNFTFAKVITLSYSEADKRVLLKIGKRKAVQFKLGSSAIQKLKRRALAVQPQTTKEVRSRSVLSRDVTAGGSASVRVDNPLNKIFKLGYLGLGQRVALTGLEDARTINEIIDGLVDAIDNKGGTFELGSFFIGDEDPAGGPLLKFNANSQWLMGARMSFMEVVDIAFIFNDPVVYGIRISIGSVESEEEDEAVNGSTESTEAPANNKKKKKSLGEIFGGFEFEILYRKVDENVGVYQAELVLPDFIRNQQFGAVAVTLPVVAMAIYTNGDFTIDLGFPHGGDFSRSFAMEVLPFIGAGGFYFSKLSAATATSTPAVTSGVFDPVYEFGLGLSIGLGKSFEKGPLSAEISISVQGIIEGVISWYKKQLGQTAEGELFYALRGSISIVGRIAGAVDFVVIRIDVAITARATIQFVIEIYKDIEIKLIAEVSVEASVTVLFVSVSFEFTAKVEHEFTIPSPSGTNPPWPLAAGDNGQEFVRPRAAMLARAFRPTSRSIPNWSTDVTFNFISGRTNADPIELDLFFQPGLSWKEGKVVGEVLLFLENTDKTDGRDFGDLIKGLLEWSWKVLGLKSSDLSLPKQEDIIKKLQGAYDKFVDPGTPTYSYSELKNFLSDHYRFHLQQAPQTKIDGTIFPVFPELELQLGAKPPKSFADTSNQLTAATLQKIKEKLDQLRVRFDSAGNGAVPSFSAGSVPEFLFVDYTRLLIRSGMQACIDHVKSKVGSFSSFKALFTDMGTMPFSNAAGMASRFMMHGMRLPRVDGKFGNALYEASRQQFDLSLAETADKHHYEITLKDPTALPAADSGEVPLLKFADGDDTIRSLTYRIDKGTAENSTAHPLIASVTAMQATGGTALKSALPNLVKLDPEEAAENGVHNGQLRLKRIPLYKKERLRFALRKHTSLDPDDDALKYLVKLPSSMIHHLRNTRPAPTISLSVEPHRDDGGPALSRTFGSSEYAWATRLDIGIQEVAKIAGDGVLPNTFALTGMVESEKDHLEDVWTNLRAAGGSTQVEIRLLRAQDSGKVDSKLEVIAGEPTDFAVIKTNLSTNSGKKAEGAVGATLANATEALNFLQLLWEGSIVGGGGYYLHLGGITKEVADAILHKGGQGTIQLLISFTNVTQAAAYHNSVIFNDTAKMKQKDGTEVPLDLTEHLLVAESSATMPMLNIPAGHLGFELERNKPAANPADGLEELKNLYQLMGYEVEGKDGLPIGPTKSPNAGQWLYEGVFPTFPLFPKLTGVPVAGPDLEKDLYRGIAPGAQVQVSNWWQDLYGNDFPASKVSDNKFDLAYTDPLIGLNQWPSVAERYSFLADSATKATMQVNLTFEAEAYATDVEKIKAAIQLYEKVYFQLVQPDISFTLSTTLIEGPGKTLDRDSAFGKKLIGFVASAHKYLVAQLSTVENGSTNAEAIPSCTHDFSWTYKSGNTFKYPKQFIFGLRVELTIERALDRIHTALRAKAEHQQVQKALAYLTPDPGIPVPAATDTDNTISLKHFAEKFEAAFTGLRVAVSQEREQNNSNLAAGDQESLKNLEARPLYVVQLGAQGILYDIEDDTAAPGDEPAFFALPPLSNALHSAKVNVNTFSKSAGLSATKSKEVAVESADLNVLGRSFLVALEALLRPEYLTPARQIAAAEADAIITCKGDLAEHISSKVAAILKRDKNKTDQLAQAVKVLKQQLLVNLVDGFDIETIVSYQVALTVGSHFKPAGGQSVLNWAQGQAPRIAGKPAVIRASVDEKELDYSLSPTEIPLRNDTGPTYFTYLFDTKTPEKFDNVRLELEFKMTGIEYQIEPVPGNEDYQASTWLSFITDGTADSMGTSAVPIPLKSYPMPPSLILQEAQADADSKTDLTKIREWAYAIIYEHVDIAQDVIDCIVELNKQDNTFSATDSLGAGELGLLTALVNFQDNYPAIMAVLNTLPDAGRTTTAAEITTSLTAFKTLVQEVAVAWGNWDNRVTLHQSQGEDLHFEIQEKIDNDQKQVDIRILRPKGVTPSGDVPDPVVELPGVEPDETPIVQKDSKGFYLKTFEFAQDDAAPLQTFGDSAVPDRRLRIDNLDIIHHQNAWAGIWLSRNKVLVEGTITNPVFIFQTPMVKFNNMLTPFLINRVRHDVNQLNTTGGAVPLGTHLENLFGAVLPATSPNGYQIRISCRYAFAMVKGKNLGGNLFTELPILLGQPLDETDTNDIPASYPQELATQIASWFTEHEPSRDDAFLAFTFNIFAKRHEDEVGNLPLLKIEQLFLALEDVSDLG